ncbi:acyltransferase [Rugosimonospora africana]|uniref:Acyltransferase n=2 Tax=Rugosimonospora africana TaxID=556532 RepID=A0A8J3VV67_9ACTN|nr:acyltransferase [Rugosimonospora africana]
MSVAVFHLLAVAGWGTGVNIWGRPSSAVFGHVFVAASYGWVGVPLFFIISGFVIPMSSWGRTPAQFATSRVVRLFPAYWVCVLVTTAVVRLYPWVFKPLPVRAVLTNLTMFQDPLGVHRVDDAYWTLWVEMKFYLLFMVVIWLGLNYRRVVAFCLIWSVATMWVGELNQPWLNAIVMPGYSQYFIAGIALFLMFRYGRNLVLWLILGLSWVLSMHFYAGNPWQQIVRQSYAPASILVTLCFIVMILVALGELNWLRWRGLTTLGQATYPLYLLHYVIGFSVIYYLNEKLSLPPALLLILVLAALVSTAWLVHRLVERPFAPWLRKALSRPILERRLPQVPMQRHPAVAGQRQPVAVRPVDGGPGGHDGDSRLRRPAADPPFDGDLAPR